MTKNTYTHTLTLASKKTRNRFCIIDLAWVRVVGVEVIGEHLDLEH